MTSHQIVSLCVLVYFLMTVSVASSSDCQDAWVKCGDHLISDTKSCEKQEFKTSCKKTCGFCGDCQDLWGICGYRITKDMKLCDMNVYKGGCRKTCGLCGVCSDIFSDCWKSNCQENFWKVYCRQTCNECVDQTTGGHVRDETATSTTTTTATRTQYPPEITSYTDKQVFSAGETVTLTCRSKNTRDTRGALNWHSSRNGVRNITREASDGSIQLDILQISTEYDGMSVTCVEKGKIADTLSSITIRVDMSSVWGQWETWSACSATCGDGSRSRRRSCSVTRGACQGEATQTDTCNITACCVPQHGRWSDWSSWSSCSVSCGQGTRTRSRTCSGQNVCGRPCEGNNVAKEYCNPSKCPAWGSWSSWTCSVTCGTGTMSRTRTCTPPSATCSGDASDQQECQRPACCVPTHGQWNDWGSWSSCSVSCGEGTRTRLRTCSEPNACGHCEGNNVTEEYCNDYVCPGKCR